MSRVSASGQKLFLSVLLVRVGCILDHACCPAQAVFSIVGNWVPVIWVSRYSIGPAAILIFTLLRVGQTSEVESERGSSPRWKIHFDGDLLVSPASQGGREGGGHRSG